MTNVKLTDKLGLTLDAKPASTSALLKYFQQLPVLKLETLTIAQLAGATIDQPTLQELNVGLNFENPVSLGENAPSLTIDAGVNASLQVIRDPGDLPGDDPTFDAAPNTRYLCLTMDATASAGVSLTAGKAEFGVTPSTELELSSYVRFPLGKQILLTQALADTIAQFRIPLTSSDLVELPAGHVSRAAVTGKLSFSGDAQLFANANPLASATLPSPLPAATVSAGGSATIGATCELSTQYEIVANKLDSGAVHLGWYRTRAAEVSVRAKVSEGITAGIGTGDLFSQVVTLISANPKADAQELTAAGVPDAQSAAIQGAVKSAVARKLEVAVAAAFSTSGSRSAAFLYEIQPAALTDDSRRAVDAALDGDLSILHRGDVPGVRCIRSMWDDVRKRQIELIVNLLGILNYRSVASLALKGEVLFEPVTGNLVITDSATAQRIRSTQVNYGADTQKLRHVLAESFLITAAYRGAGQLAIAPSLHSSHSFFQLDNSTTRDEMARKLRTGVALGLLPDSDAVPPSGVEQFGRTLFSVSTEYDDALLLSMFLDTGGNPRPVNRYETIGRQAWRSIVHPDDFDAIRLQPATDDELWRRMKEVGQPGFRALFPGVPTPLVGAITADYTTIVWWAGAMHDAARQIAAIRRWLAQHPAAPAMDPELQKLRHQLADCLKEVAAQTREEFGEPWGLIAMSLLAGGAAGAKFQISGPILVRSAGHSLAAATGS